MCLQLQEEMRQRDVEIGEEERALELLNGIWEVIQLVNNRGPTFWYKPQPHICKQLITQLHCILCALVINTFSC